MKIDGVFSGGGVKAFAYIGALEVLEEKEFSFVRVAGSSAGAIVSGMIAAGYTVKEMNQLFVDLDLNNFMDTSLLEKYVPIWKWFSLYFTMGLYKGDEFENWLYQVLAKKNVYTFHDLPKDSLRVVVADLTLGKIVVIPDDLERLYNIRPESFLVAKAIRMSASLPYFFRPEKMVNTHGGKSIVVDGAVLSNLPIWIFDQQTGRKRRPVLGLKLTASYDQIPAKKITNALDLTRDLIDTMRIAHDARYISTKHQEDILFLPVKDVHVADLELTKKDKDKLIAFGRMRASSFLKHWPS
ncbi:Patatin-like phospholipase [Paraliobacillus sp. PM-2]|uniref:patatin-like phospholipase family protein n=1 Tax=Paraliobacillus sp. PM-2 TaxID=1462524 RepID=UPI00061C122A|nr:patatin-like phospholipase family protein [Paraliobacillus sp. PM-2]CQR46802.1 Patatin-like phospholipase [Paraliobacillus sp. PM-2]